MIKKFQENFKNHFKNHLVRKAETYVEDSSGSIAGMRGKIIT